MSENEGSIIGQASPGISWADHFFQEADGINRCVHCGRTLMNFMRGGKKRERFWSFGSRCAIPETCRFPEPSADDNFAVFSWHSLGRKFFVTESAAVDFTTSDAAKGREWVGPLPIFAIPTTPHNGSDFPSFREHVRQLGTLRQASGVSIERAWDDLIARGFDDSDRTSLSTCYLRDGWEALETAANERAGHFIESQAHPEPYRALLNVAMDFDDELRCQAIGPVGAALLFGSVQLHRHLEGFAGTHLRLTGLDDEVLARAVYWALKDCHVYAATLQRDRAAPKEQEPSVAPGESGQHTGKTPADIETRAKRRQAVVAPILKRLKWSKNRWAIEVVTQSGVSTSSVFRYYNGESTPRPDTIEALAKSLGVQDLPS